MDSISPDGEMRKGGNNRLGGDCFKGKIHGEREGGWLELEPGWLELGKTWLELSTHLLEFALRSLEFKLKC